MDTQQYAEGNYINAELVKSSPSKELYISGDAVITAGDYGDKLELPVELDGKKKTWTLSRDHVKALQLFGKDSKQWVGKNVNLSVINVAGKERLLAQPVIIPVEKVK